MLSVRDQVLDSASFAPDGPDEVQLLVKRYDSGEMSRWMHRLRVGDDVRVRGPVITWDYREGALDEVVLVRPSPPDRTSQDG